jgi:hypothetical protein
MAKLKAYTLGISGMPGHKVIDALGLENWIRQAKVCPAERTKAAAHRLLETRSIFISIRDPEFRADRSPYIDALDMAGLLDEPAVFVWPFAGQRSNRRVVRLDEGGIPVLIGEFQSVDRKVVLVEEAS